MPSSWAEQIEEAAEVNARPAVLTGDDPSSLEPAGTEIEYGLVDGIAVAAALPWLDDLYRTEWQHAASEFYGQPLEAANDVRCGVNINSVRGEGSRYEWHRDTNPCTGLLFVTTLGPDDGGVLVFSQGAMEVHLRPTAGTLLIFDARATPHTVTSLKRPVHRISVPMNYYLAGEPQIRSSLDDYLYTEKG